MKNWENHKILPFFLLILLISFTACDSFKKVQRPDRNSKSNGEELDEIQGTRVYNPETGEYEVVTDVTGELDTIRWKDAPQATTIPPITSEATQSENGLNFDENTEYLNSYNLVLALPFLSDKYNQFGRKIDRRSIPALNFYEGAKMAFDVLSREGVNLEVSVLDTRAEERTTLQLTKNYALETAHLVIGTFRNSTAKVMATFAQKNETTFVSPFYPHQNLIVNNPYFIQLNPSERTHAEVVMEHVKEKFRPEQIVVFGRNNVQERRLMDYYLNAHYALEGSTFVDSIQLVIIDDESPSLDNTDFKIYMDDINTTAFIIASSSQSFVYAMLRNIDLVKDDRSIIVYGQPRWKDFTQIGYQYYETLNVHITSESYLNPNELTVQTFKESFFDKFGMPPTNEAFKGYDTMLYFGRMLKEFGTGFRHKLDQNAEDGLHTKFDIQRTITQPKTGGLEGTALEQFDLYMNKHLNILEFSGYQFRKAD